MKKNKKENKKEKNFPYDKHDTLLIFKSQKNIKKRTGRFFAERLFLKND